MMNPTRTCFVVHELETGRFNTPEKGSIRGRLDPEEVKAVDREKLEAAIQACDPVRACQIAGRVLDLGEIVFSEIPDCTLVGEVTDHKRELLNQMTEVQAHLTNPAKAIHTQFVREDLTRRIVDQVGTVRLQDNRLTVFTPEGPFLLQAQYPNTVAESNLVAHRYRIDDWFSQRPDLDFSSSTVESTQPWPLPDHPDHLVAAAEPAELSPALPKTRIDPARIVLRLAIAQAQPDLCNMA